ncbi:MAG: polymer-forming cytoskeletal protein [Verrucomicrobia bacterium]|nr:polymer-forming cytoskeletal protein [Verrucomicrobiota bacterium]
MFKKYSKGFSDAETNSPQHPQEELPFRPHSPFSTDLMNAFSIRENQSLQEETGSDGEEEPETIISSQVNIKGTMSFQKLLRIDGTFEGELISSGNLIVGPTGSVKANINLDSAFISGKVVGDITVKTRLVLRGRAEVRGNVTAPLVSMDEGVSIIGQLNVAPLSAAPQEEESPIDYD